MSRGVHDIHKHFERDDWYHEVYTLRGHHLQEYTGNPKRYIFWLNGEVEFRVCIGLNQRVVLQGLPLKPVSDPETYRWTDRYRHWELEVTAIDALFNKYEIDYLFPENYQHPIFPEEASSFLFNFQDKHPESALHVRLKWQRQENEVTTYPLTEEAGEPIRVQNKKG